MKKKSTAPKPKKSATPVIYPQPDVDDAPQLSLLSDVDLSELYTHSSREKINYVRSGVSKDELVSFKDKLNLDYDSLSRILSVSRAKLLKKKSTEKFDLYTSERILMLADLVGYGYRVFEDKASFNEWLKTPNTALSERTPLDLMDTMYGIGEVRNLIGRIEHGIY